MSDVELSAEKKRKQTTVNKLKPNKNAISPTVYIFNKQHKKLFSIHPVEKKVSVPCPYYLEYSA